MQPQPFLDESVIYQDGDRPIIEKLELVSHRLKKAIVAFAIFAILLLILVSYLGISAATDPEAQNLRIGNKELTLYNQQLSGNNSKMERDIQMIEINIGDLNANISRLNQDINATNQELADLQENIKQNCDIYHQKLRLDGTNLNNIKISLPATNYNQPVPEITDMSLSNNKLSKFCDNSLPNLLNIDLTNNFILNMSNNKLNSITSLSVNGLSTLKIFDGNYLPVLTKLDVGNNLLTTLKNNYFPLLQVIQASNNRITEISNFTLYSLFNLSILENPLRFLKNNTFSALEVLYGMDSSTLKQVNNNYLGKIQSFALNCQKDILIFQLNKIPKLRNLTINNCQYDFSKIKTNDFPLLSYLRIVDSRLDHFQYFQELKLLQELSLSSTNITAFSNHTYYITSLDLIGNTNLNSFENNNFSRLEYLRFVNTSNIQDICHNYMPNVKHMQLAINNIRNFTCFNNYQNLEFLDTLYGSVQSVNFLDLLKLKQLLLRQARLSSFQANRLPSLEHLHIQVVTTKIDFTSFQNILQILQLIGPFTTFSNKQFPMLKNLTLTSNGQQQMEFVNNSFPQLTAITLNNISMSNFDKNVIGPLQSMIIYSCLSEQTLGSSFDNTLQYLEIRESMFKDFSNKKMPELIAIKIINSHLDTFKANEMLKVKEVDLSRNYLQKFDCRMINFLEKINLSFNLLTDDISQDLCSCRLKYLTYIDLRENQKFKDPVQIRRRLSECYQAQIQI